MLGVGHAFDANFEDDRVSWIGGVVMNLEEQLESNLEEQLKSLGEELNFSIVYFHKISNTIFISVIFESGVEVDMTLNDFGDGWAIRSMCSSVSVVQWPKHHKLIQPILDKIIVFLNEQGGQS